MLSDDATIEAQIGRPTRAVADVVARCSLGLPIVVRMPPVLPSGEPFPTRYWLTCPLAHRRIARIEADGGVARFDQRAREDAAFADALALAHARYKRDRERDLSAEVSLAPRGGVGGSLEGVKCLHAHFADYVGSEGAHSNPVGALVAADVLPLSCTSPCVVAEDSRGVRSRSWREPARVVPRSEAI